MNRRDALESSAFLVTSIQTDLYRCARQYMSDNNMTQTKLAEHLNMSKGYVSQLLNGDYDHKLSKLVELSIAFGFVPQLTFVPIDEYARREQSPVK